MNRGVNITIDSTQKFIIYGASYIGRQIKDSLRKQGYQVLAFLDKDAMKYNYEVDEDVLLPENSIITEKIKSTCIVIVAITNPVEHAYVAKYLQKLGYKHIIYKSYQN